jgi:hypothetical protein
VPVADPCAAHELAGLVEDFHAVARTLADVQQPAAAHVDAVHVVGEHAGHAVLDFLRRPLAAPLAQEFAVLVEHHYAAVAVAIGHE